MPQSLAMYLSEKPMRLASRMTSTFRTEEARRTSMSVIFFRLSRNRGVMAVAACSSSTLTPRRSSWVTAKMPSCLNSRT